MEAQPIICIKEKMNHLPNSIIPVITLWQNFRETPFFEWRGDPPYYGGDEW